MKYQAQVQDSTFDIEITSEGDVIVNGQAVNVSLLQVGPLGLYSMVLNNHSYELVVEEGRSAYRITIGSDTLDVEVADEREMRLRGGREGPAAPGGELIVKAPIPGLVARVLVNVGDVVKAKQSIAILEAMKMENDIRAPRDGIVLDVKVKAGQSIEQNSPILILGDHKE